MRLAPQDPSQTEITISKKKCIDQNEQGLLDLVDSFFEVQVSLDDPKVAQNIMHANKDEILNKVVEINNERLDQII